MGIRRGLGSSRNSPWIILYSKTAVIRTTSADCKHFQLIFLCFLIFFFGNRVADLGDLFGPITFNTNESVYFEFESSSESEFALVGAKGVWGRSMVLVGPSQEKSCASIIVRSFFSYKI